MAQNQISKEMQEQLDRTVRALQSNRMDACWVENKEAALEKVRALLKPGCTAASGGSVTLAECGIMELLRSGDYQYLDRDTVSREELPALFRKSFSADVYLMSSNAVTEQGELYNVDGNENRVAALIYGPESVIVVAGVNKIVKDIPEAIRRVKELTAPKNVQRLNQKTGCAACGTCVGLNGDMAAGCKAEQRICCSYVVSGYQRFPNRIKVILVAESLGY